MTIIRTTFDHAGELYTRLFSDWLHINFIIRTILLLLIVWLLIYLGAQFFQYILAPLFMLFFYHVIFRVWNYFAVETPQEAMYIKYSKNEEPFSERYLKLCDKVKRNRTTLNHAKYMGMIIRSRKFTLRLMIFCLVVATLWISAFGLHQRYAAPVMVQNGVHVDASDPNGPGDYPHEQDEPTEYPSQVTYAAGHIDPSAWEEGEEIILHLNELGQPGARLRDGPGILGYSVIEILWEYDQMVYLHEFTPDPDVEGLYWLRVLSPSGTIGYISSQLVEVP